MARWIAVALALVAVLAGVVHSLLPNLRLQRAQITSSPGLEPLFGRADITLKSGRTLCIAPVTIDPATRIAQFKLTPGPRLPRRLTVTVTGPGGYRSTSGPVAPLYAKYLQPVQFRLAPTRRSIQAKACLRNGSRHPLAVLATNEAQSQTPADTTVDGRVMTNDDATLLLLEGRSASMTQRAGTIVSRASTFAGGWLAPWLLWIVLALFAATGVAALVTAFAAGRERP